MVGTIPYEGFGQTVATSGYRDDGDAGLLHVGARYYDPQVGRFLTRDTYLGEHPYLYCEHDPVNATDPSGHKLKEFISALLDLLGTLLTGPTPPGKPQIIPPPAVPPGHIGSPPPWWPNPPEPPPGYRVIIPREPPWRSPGSGGGIGAIGTIVVGTGVAAEGMLQVIRYRRKIESYLDPDGDWTM